MSPHTGTVNESAPRRFFAQVAGLAGTGMRAMELVWSSSRPLTGALAALTLAAGILPAVTAWLGKKVIDAVVAAANIYFI